MALLESLPGRPLEPSELTKLNQSEALDLAISVESDGPAESLLLATESWVKGLCYEDAAGWRVVETVELSRETPRIDGLQRCEAAIEAARDSAQE
jgi:hypothetical protein